MVSALVPVENTAWTRNVCEPYESGPAYTFGLVQAAKREPSRRHWRLDPARLSVKENDADVSVEGFVGVAVSVGAGAWATVHEKLVALPVPEASRARTWNVWFPDANPLYAFGLVHAADFALSSWHSNVTPARASENEKVAVPSAVEAGGVESRVGAGGGETCHEY
jgi:hypothetical protein